MQVIVKARHMNLTPALRAYAEKKLGASVMRIFDKPAAKLEIELGALAHSQDGNVHECRITAFLPKAKTIHIVESADDMYKAIDNAHDRLLEDVKRQRGKVKRVARHRKDLSRKRMAKADSDGRDKPLWEREVFQYERSMSAL